MASKVYIQEKINLVYPLIFKVFGSYPFKVVFGDYHALNKFIIEHKQEILFYNFELEELNPKYNYPSFSNYKARIEKGAIIRERVKIEDDAIILMGAVINVGAYIGHNTMIDMNAVIGSSAYIKDNVHIGAGAIIAGVLEPISLEPVVIENNVFIGANAVIKEGVTVRKNSIIGASSFVTHSTEEGYIYYGIPARKIRKATLKDYQNLRINKDLRR